MVANNAFMIEEMKAKAKKEGKEKFKALPDDYKKKLMTLPEKNIDEIVTQIFEMESIEELDKYFKIQELNLKNRN